MIYQAKEFCSNHSTKFIKYSRCRRPRKWSSKYWKVHACEHIWGSKFVILARRLMWVIRYSKPDIYIKTSVSVTAFHCLCVYQAQNRHTIHTGQQSCHNRHVPTPWHSASLMSKYSVSEHVIQNLVHSAQSIAFDLYTHIFKNFTLPTPSVYESTQKA